MTRRITRAIVAIAFLVTLAGSVVAQGRPDLNGTWKLNASKSKFTSLEVPANVVIRLESHGTTLHETLIVSRSGFETTSSLSYDLSGREIVNRVDGEEIKTIARLDGNTLVLEWKDQGGTATRRLVFASDGKSMTMEERDTDPNTQSGDLLTLEKQ